MRFRASEVAAATGGRLIGIGAEADVMIDGVSFDSRSIVPGQLFVPLIDARDGHDFIDVAIAAGASCYLSSRPIAATAVSAVMVDDTLRALMRLAADRRRRSPSTVIGITGSVGKTSTKDLAWAALAATRRTWANERSFNNDQGVPTTILNAPDDTEVMVLEMGMRGFGEIARLCEIAAPTIGVVTRVAEAHSDRVGGIAGVARAKAELIAALPSTGVAVLNGDDPFVRAMATTSPAAVVMFGTAEDCDVRIVDVRLDGLARASFGLQTPWGTVDVRLGVSGGHMVANAAAALACVGVVGGDVIAGAAALSDVELTAMRMHVATAASGATVLDDSYNANPTSMRAALDALASLPATRRIAVLGVMAEISDPVEEHRAITRYAQALGIEVIPVGTDLYSPSAQILRVGALEELEELGPGDAVLVKGSRIAGLDRLAATLRAR